jgi:hypothetical protein
MERRIKTAHLRIGSEQMNTTNGMLLYLIQRGYSAFHDSASLIIGLNGGRHPGRKDDVRWYLIKVDANGNTLGHRRTPMPTTSPLTI